MKIISTYFHGLLDYAGAIALFFAPDLFGFADFGGTAVLIPRMVGVLILTQSLITSYESGILRILPMKAHLMTDCLISLFLIASPWIFGFRNGRMNVWMPPMIAGIFVLALTLLSKTSSPNKRLQSLQSYHFKHGIVNAHKR